jgi:hypothetical protein
MLVHILDLFIKQKKSLKIFQLKKERIKFVQQWLKEEKKNISQIDLISI